MPPRMTVREGARVSTLGGGACTASCGDPKGKPWSVVLLGATVLEGAGAGAESGTVLAGVSADAGPGAAASVGPIGGPRPASRQPAMAAMERDTAQKGECKMAAKIQCSVHACGNMLEEDG